MDIEKLAHIKNYVLHPESKTTIRFHDCDPFRHLNQARYLDYFVECREDQLREHYGLDMFRYAMENQHGWMVIKNQIAYLRQATVNEVVVMQTHVIHFDLQGIKVEMIMWDENKIKPKALLWGDFIYVNLKESKRANHPEALMTFYKKLYWNGVEGKTFDQRVNELYAWGKTKVEM